MNPTFPPIGFSSKPPSPGGLDSALEVPLFNLRCSKWL
ncbi:hypothetical protein COLO4_16131 [Corchorus olitorius]|uniref:Uncharacterized protein n=1 Tax=Corchorus olitorius TaxID=93759 RepID=A0A1R3JJC5_9ROSI|nr:hypothetical protein COLO4_16131 [Corchorus olitorius]